MWVSFRLPSCTCQPCMYVLSPPPPPLHTSYFLYYILSLTSLLTLPTLTLTSLHSLTPHTDIENVFRLFPFSLSPPPLFTLLTLHTPHTPHTDTENLFRLTVWVLDDREKNSFTPLTPSHPPTLTQSKAGVDWVSRSFILH